MKSTSAEVEGRVTKVAERLVAGWSRADICEYARENWGISDSQVDRYSAKARELIRESRQDSWKDSLAMADARLELLFRETMEKGDLRTALSVVKAQAELQRPEPGRGGSYRDNADFVACLYAYATALKSVLPPEYLGRVTEAVRGLAPVEESLQEADVCEAMLQQCVEDHRVLGRGRTREELVEAGFFDGLMLPG